MSNLRSILKKEDGFTLTEMLVYSAIMVVLLGGMYTIFGGSQSTYLAENNQVAEQRDARVAQMQMTKYLRMAQSFASAGDYSTSFCADINDDNLLETVNFYLANGNLYMTMNNGGAKLLAAGMQNAALNQPLFIYYDLHGLPITDMQSRITKTCQVDINLIIDEDPNNPPGAYTLRSEVTLRNHDN